MAKEETREDEQALPPEDTEEESTEADDKNEDSTEEEAEESGDESDDEEGDSEQDIDFEKELEALESSVSGEESDSEQAAPKKKTEEEKAGYTVQQTVKRLKKQGKTDAEISKLVGFTVKTEEDEEDEDPAQKPGYVTRDELDLRDAEKEASRLARSEAEKKVIMHYVRYNRLSVVQAHLLANRGRITRNAEELLRKGEARPAALGAAGRRDTVDKKPRFSKEEMATMTRRGMKWNPQTNRMEGKYTFVRLDAKTGERVTGKLEKKK